MVLVGTSSAARRPDSGSRPVAAAATPPIVRTAASATAIALALNRLPGMPALRERRVGGQERVMATNSATAARSPASSSGRGGAVAAASSRASAAYPGGASAGSSRTASSRSAVQANSPLFQSAPAAMRSSAVAASGFQAPGANRIIDIRKCITTLRAAGYMPDTVFLTPADSEALDLLVTGIASGTADFVFAPGQFAPGTLFGLNVVVSKGIAASVVAQLLDGGATVIATTSKLDDNRLAFYRTLYRDNARFGAKLWVVPANMASYNDIDALARADLVVRNGTRRREVPAGDEPGPDDAHPQAAHRRREQVGVGAVDDFHAMMARRLEPERVDVRRQVEAETVDDLLRFPDHGPLLAVGQLHTHGRLPAPTPILSGSEHTSA